MIHTTTTQPSKISSVSMVQWVQRMCVPVVTCCDCLGFRCIVRTTSGCVFIDVTVLLVGTGRSGKLRNKTVFSDKSFMLFAVADESDDFEDFPCRASDSRNEFEDDLFCPSLDNTHGGLPVWMLESSESRPRSELDLRVPLFGTAESMYVPFLGLSHGSAFVPMNQFSPDTTASRNRCRVQSSTQTSPIFSNFRGIESRHNDPRPVFSHDEQDNVSSLYPIFELPQQPGVPTRRESLRMEFNNIENINRNDDPRALPNSFNLSIEKYLDTIAVEKVRPTNSLLLVHQPNNDNEDPSSGRVSRADESPQREGLSFPLASEPIPFPLRVDSSILNEMKCDETQPSLQVDPCTVRDGPGRVSEAPLRDNLECFSTSSMTQWDGKNSVIERKSKTRTYSSMESSPCSHSENSEPGNFLRKSKKAPNMQISLEFGSKMEGRTMSPLCTPLRDANSLEESSSESSQRTRDIQASSNLLSSIAASVPIDFSRLSFHTLDFRGLDQHLSLDTCVTLGISTNTDTNDPVRFFHHSLQDGKATPFVSMYKTARSSKWGNITRRVVASNHHQWRFLVQLPEFFSDFAASSPGTASLSKSVNLVLRTFSILPKSNDNEPSDLSQKLVSWDRFELRSDGILRARVDSLDQLSLFLDFHFGFITKPVSGRLHDLRIEFDIEVRASQVDGDQLITHCVPLHIIMDGLDILKRRSEREKRVYCKKQQSSAFM